MKPVIFVLPPFLGKSDVRWVGKMEDGGLPHVLEKLHHTFAREIASVQDAGFIKELLLHIQVVTPIAGLEEAPVILKAGLDQAPQRSQNDEEEKDGPANRLNRARKVKINKSCRSKVAVIVANQSVSGTLFPSTRGTSVAAFLLQIPPLVQSCLSQTFSLTLPEMNESLRLY